MSLAGAILKLVLRPAFTAAATGMYSFVHLSSQISDPVYLLMSSAVIAGATGLASETAGQIAGGLAFAAGCEVESTIKGWPVGEVFLEEATSGGPVSKASTLIGWGAWLAAGLFAMNMIQAKLTDSFNSLHKQTASYSEPAQQQRPATVAPVLAPPAA